MNNTELTPNDCLNSADGCCNVLKHTIVALFPDHPQVRWTRLAQCFLIAFGWLCVIRCRVGRKCRRQAAALVIFCQSACMWASVLYCVSQKKKIEHVANRCSAVSSSLKQRTQAALWGQRFPMRQSTVWHFPRMASQINIRHLRGASIFQVNLWSEYHVDPSNYMS
jgi:hypothetical protein